MRFEHDILNTIAGVSITFVGFSALLGALSQKKGIHHSTIRFKFMVEVGLMTLLFCFLPFVPSSLGWSEECVWRFSSAILVAYLSAAVALGLCDLRKLRQQDHKDLWTTIKTDDAPIMFCISVVLGCLAFIIQIRNIKIGEYNPYLLGVLFLLCWTGLLFFTSFRANQKEKENEKQETSPK